MTHQFQNQRVLVTGCSAGIGKAAATAFADQGAYVIIVSRSDDAGPTASHITGAILPVDGGQGTVIR